MTSMAQDHRTRCDLMVRVVEAQDSTSMVATITIIMVTSSTMATTITTTIIVMAITTMVTTTMVAIEATITMDMGMGVTMENIVITNQSGGTSV